MVYRGAVVDGCEGRNMCIPIGRVTLPLIFKTFFATRRRGENFPGKMRRALRRKYVADGCSWMQLWLSFFYSRGELMAGHWLQEEM